MVYPSWISVSAEVWILPRLSFCDVLRANIMPWMVLFKHCFADPIPPDLPTHCGVRIRVASYLGCSFCVIYY